MFTNPKLINNGRGFASISEAAKYLENHFIDEFGRLHNTPINRGPARYQQRKIAKFDFASQLAKGSILFIGEGNLSFCLSLAKHPRINPFKLTATTFESKNNLSELAKDNALKLKSLGTNVTHGVNASKLHTTFGHNFFDTIVFQFPHTGSREPINGHHPNFVLIRNFLKSAAHQLSSDGKVIITAVDSPHYRGAFQFEKAAKAAGFLPPKEYSFEPSAFPGYTHTMTNEDDSALESHDHFTTWVFELPA